MKLVRSHNLRDLRGELLALAYGLALDGGPADQGLCLLLDSRITPQRLDEERQLLRMVLQPQVAERIRIDRHAGRGKLASGPDPGAEFQTWLSQLVGRTTSRTAAAGTSWHSVFAYLVLGWLRQAGPQSTQAIQEAVGASYPTVCRGNHNRAASARFYFHFRAARISFHGFTLINPYLADRSMLAVAQRFLQ